MAFCAIVSGPTELHRGFNQGGLNAVIWFSGTL